MKFFLAVRSELIQLCLALFLTNQPHTLRSKRPLPGVVLDGPLFPDPNSRHWLNDRCRLVLLQAVDFKVGDPDRLQHLLRVLCYCLRKKGADVKSHL